MIRLIEDLLFEMETQQRLLNRILASVSMQLANIDEKLDILLKKFYRGKTTKRYRSSVRSRYRSRKRSEEVPSGEEWGDYYAET